VDGDTASGPIDRHFDADRPAGLTDAKSPSADWVCAQEPIHIPGSIQPHGAILALDPVGAFIVVAASRNAAELLRVDTPNVFGRDAASLLGADFAEAIRARLQAGRLRGEAPWRSSLRPNDRSPVFDVAVHSHAGLILVELEPVGEHDDMDAQTSVRQLHDIIVDLRESAGDLDGLARVAARGLRLLLGYERVIVYRFDTDSNGESIAEDKVDGWEQSLNGLRFPASDIPAQARELYRRSPMRWVANRDAPPMPLDIGPARYGDRPAPRSIDLSFAGLRSLSPVHMEIHRNLDIDGSMSLSILFDGRLWGLMVCHHRQPHHPPPHRRVAAMALADAFALRVGPTPHGGVEQARRNGLVRLSALLAHMANADVVSAALTTGEVTIESLFDTTGAAVLHAGEVTRMGSTPPEAELRAFAAWLRSRDDGGQQFHTNNLTAVYPGWERHAAVASGVMAVFLSADRADMLLWFRPEEPQLVSWGSASQMRTPEAAITRPRPSFERWAETRHGFAKPWAEWELEVAETLRHSITEVIVRGLHRIADLHERLRHSQKMEAVGQLTGGIAHDFNNLLAGIIGSLELVQTRVTQGRLAEVERYVGTAMTSANRAASLIHRLLAFSRRQTLDPRPVDVNRLAASLEDLIRRTVGPAIQVETVIAGGLWKALCDANQLENAVLNLAINARDAMPAGGRLTVEATNAYLDEAYARRHDGITPGQYVAVSVTDTGVGMPADVIARVFEPFFTTKPPGQGTGLGLSMVYGFARQSNGHASVYSEVGQGTTVRLYLPRHHGPGDVEIADRGTPVDVTAKAAETVLVVDDEPVMRMLISDVLRDLSYTVVKAATGAEGLRVLRSERQVDLLISDIGLPGGLNGRQLADAARVHHPLLKVLFITGYAENAVMGNGVLEPGMQLLTKPFAMDVLTRKVRAMMSPPGRNRRALCSRICEV